MMKAFGIRRHDRSQAFEFLNIPVPEIDDNEVLVRVAAVGVGIHDQWALPPQPRYPYAIGLEGAGVIEAVGRAVQGFSPGDRVMFSGTPQHKGGTWAEYAAVAADTLTALPNGLDVVEAAALPIAATTALEGVNALGVDQGGSVFIAGASGAIGSLAIQLARQRGYRVAASASAQNQEYLRSLGADLAVDYRHPDWAAQVLQWMPGGVDAALAIQPGTGTTSLQVIQDGGKVVTISGDQVTPEREIAVEQITHHAETRQALARLAEDAASGRVRVVIEQAYPFEQAHAALEKVVSRRARGKTVLMVSNG